MDTNNTFKTVIKTPPIIFCTIKYVVIICLLTAARFKAWFVFLLNWTDSEALGIMLQLLWFVIIELVMSQITTAFIYMLLQNKMKFKRFFSFMHFKYFKFNFLTAVTFALFFGGGTFALNFVRFSVYSVYPEKRTLFYILALTWLMLSSFKLVFAYFKAKNANDSFKNTAKIFLGFIGKNIKKIVWFNIKFIPWIIGYVFLIIVFNKTDFELVVYVMLSSCLYGLGILVYPCYILGFHKMVCSLQNKTEI